MLRQCASGRRGRSGTIAAAWATPALNAVLALEDVEVLAAAPAGEAAASAEPQGPRVTASLRVTVRQAVFLAAAQSFAREVRLLPRAARDRRRGGAGLSVGAGLR